jgi:hypothetical protein
MPRNPLHENQLESIKLQSSNQFVLKNTPVAGEIWSQIVHLKPNLKILDIERVQIPEHAIMSLLSSKSLQTVRLADVGCELVPEFFAGSTSSSLEILHLEDNIIHRFPAILERLYLQSLKILCLDGSGLDDPSCVALAGRIPEMNLHELSLSRNLISGDGIKSIADQLPSSQIKVLMLNDNDLGDQGVIFICNSGASLDKLGISKNGITAIGLDSVLGFISQKGSIDTEMRDNRYGKLDLETYHKRLASTGITRFVGDFEEGIQLKVDQLLMAEIEEQKLQNRVAFAVNSCCTASFGTRTK